MSKYLFKETWYTEAKLDFPDIYLPCLKRVCLEKLDLNCDETFPFVSAWPLRREECSCGIPFAPLHADVSLLEG